MLRRCLLLLLIAPVALPAVAEGRKTSPRLHKFGSCSNLLGYAQRHGVRMVGENLVTRRVAPPVMMPQTGADGGGSAPGALPAPAVGGEGFATSPTNVQEAGVDEPDWVKAAGSIVYAARGGRLHALDASASPPVPLGSLELPGHAQELLVHGDRALVIASLGFGGGAVGGPAPVAAQVRPVPPADWLGRTQLLELDISDPRAMRVLRTLDVEGRHVGARLTGATARVVVATEPRGLAMPSVAPESGPAQVRRRWRRSVRRTRTASWLPSAVLRDRRTGSSQRRALVRCRQVRRTQAFTGLGTLTVLTIGMERGLPAVDTDALMTGGETVYASPDRLYVASERWLGSDPSRAEVLDDAATGLHAFDTTRPGETAYVGSGEVPGYLLNQWSLSEHDGVLRAATTSMPPWQTGSASQSAVRTLEERDGRLAELGSVGGLGEGERIYAVRYMGATAFVVTFRQTDPLYTLDLSDPRAPRRLGELKVPGYSAYLHPVGDGLLLGVGQDATAEGRRTGVQLSLFDVADLANPVRLAQWGLGADSFTEVEHDHHAFLWSAPERLAVIPALRYGDDPFAGALAFRIDRGGIQEVARFSHAPASDGFPGTTFARSLVVGERLLLLSERGVLSTPLAAPGPGDFVPYSP